VTNPTVRAGGRPRLFTPGPVEIPERVLRALAQAPPHHRTGEFRAALLRVTAELKALHGTAGEVFVLAASGTGAMEAAVVNLMGPGDHALAVAGGSFGTRWVRLLEAYGVPCATVAVEWGRPLPSAELARRLDAEPRARTVFATQCETSTGTLYDIEGFARVTRERGIRLVVDAITGVAVHPLPQDAWGVDAVVCGSQKGLMIPPGLATLSLAPWATDAIDGVRLPRFYFDLRKYRKGLPTGDTAFTPAVSLVLALEESLAMIREEGLGAVHARHARVARAARAGAVAAGFSSFSSSPSHAVTALLPPGGVDAGAVVQRMRDVHGMVVAGGQDQLQGRLVRVGHMGAYTVGDMEDVSGALAECAAALGAARIEPGAAAAAARAAGQD
jgi:serine---pyruvate transaminase